MMKQLLLVDNPAVIFSKKEKGLYFILLFFFFAMYMPGVTWLYNVAMWVIFVYCIFYNSFAEKWALLKKRKEGLLVVFFFLLNCASALFSNDISEGVSWIGIRISMIVFPLSLGCIFISPLLKERVLYGFVVATCSAAVLCLLYATSMAVYNADASLLYNDNLSAIINLQSIYFAMLVNLSLFALAYLYITKSSLLPPIVFPFLLLLLLPVHFLLASRIAIIILYGFIFLFAVYKIIYGRKVKQGLLLAASLLVAAVLLFSFFPKTLNRFKELGYTKFTYGNTGRESHFNMALTPDQWNGANIRIAVWGCAWTVTKEHMVFGTGLGDKMNALKKQYAEKGFVFGVNTNRNVHNTYLDAWMSLGLIGLLLFIAGFFVLPFAISIQYRDWFGMLVIACLAISIFTETYTDRTVGNTILSFFIIFISSYKKPVLTTH